MNISNDAIVLVVGHIDLKMAEMLLQEFERVDFIITTHRGGVWDENFGELRTALPYEPVLGRHIITYSLSNYAVLEPGLGRRDDERPRLTEAQAHSLDSNVEDDSATRAVIDASYDRHSGSLDAATRAGYSLAAFESELSDGLRFVGAQRCQSCHAEEYGQWKSTDHAMALNTMIRERRHLLPTCVRCHVVGFGESPGYVDIGSEEFSNVQCEMCHGPGSAHVEKPMEPMILLEGARETCSVCHVPDHSDMNAKRTSLNTSSRSRIRRLASVAGNRLPRLLCCALRVSLVLIVPLLLACRADGPGKEDDEVNDAVVITPGPPSSSIQVDRRCTIRDRDLLAATDLYSSDSRLYILDAQAVQLNIYDLECNLIGRFARRGRGPGELLYPRGLTGDGEQIVVVDAQRGVQIYDLDGRAADRPGGARIPGLVGSFQWVASIQRYVGVITNGESFTKRWYQVEVFDSAFRPLYALEDTRIPQSNVAYNPDETGVIPFMEFGTDLGHRLFALAMPEDRLVVASSEDYAVFLFRLEDGTVLRRVRVQSEQKPWPTAEVERLSEVEPPWVRSQLEARSVPLVEGVIPWGHDGFAVVIPTGPEETALFDVFDASGQYVRRPSGPVVPVYATRALWFSSHNLEDHSSIEVWVPRWQ